MTPIGFVIAPLKHDNLLLHVSFCSFPFQWNYSRRNHLSHPSHTLLILIKVYIIHFSF